MVIGYPLLNAFPTDPAETTTLICWWQRPSVCHLMLAAETTPGIARR